MLALMLATMLAMAYLAGGLMNRGQVKAGEDAGMKVRTSHSYLENGFMEPGVTVEEPGVTVEELPVTRRLFFTGERSGFSCGLLASSCGLLPSIGRSSRTQRKLLWF